MDKRQLDNIKKSYNLPVNSSVQLLRESNDNMVFLIEGKKILRISKRLITKEDILFEYELNNYLISQHIPVAEWFLTKLKQPFMYIDTNKVVILQKFLSGHHTKIPAPQEALNAGKALCTFHEATSGLSSTTLRTRTIYSELERAFSYSYQLKKYFENGDKFLEDVDRALSFAHSFSKKNIIIHNDYRPGNVLFTDTDKVAGILDLDWACSGPPVKDVALAVLEWSFPDGAQYPDEAVFEAFLKGYGIYKRDKQLLDWIAFSALSEATTYFCDLVAAMEDEAKTDKRPLKSYMYKKYLFFRNQLQAR